MLLVGGGCVNASNTAESNGRSGISASMRENSVLENPDESVMVAKSSKNFDFKYREAYLPENIDPSASAMFAENNVGRDWGIWGHNLYRIVKVDENADASVYATVNGERYDGQYCFSSQVLHDAIKGYIIDNFGNGDKSSSRFLIMPGDDDAVCNCDLCVKAGNSAGNATPAVSKLVENLAKEFPGHVFFMGAYGSTFMPPVYAMPTNVGVMVSAMRWPLSSLYGGKRRSDFDALVQEWKEKCMQMRKRNIRTEISEYLEVNANEVERVNGYDIADYLIKVKSGEAVLQSMTRKNPALKLLIKTFDLELSDFGTQ